MDLLIPTLLIGLLVTFILSLLTPHRKHKRVRETLSDELLLKILHYIIKEGNLVTREELNAEFQLLLDAIVAETAEVTAAIQALKDAIEAANVPVDFTPEFAAVENAIANIGNIVVPPVV